jgi:hypothetical protein
MSARPFEVRVEPEPSYRREAMLAVELLDPVTLERVSQGVQVTAVGLTSKPIVNFSGLFVWLRQPTTDFQQLTIEPGTRPFERMEIPAAQVQLPLHSVELKPLANYPFAPGATAIRGALYETSVPPGATPAPVAGAAIRLAWLHEDGLNWVASPATAVTDAKGVFTAILRLAPAQVTALDAQGRMSIRLFAKRGAGGEKHHQFLLQHGRVTDQAYAWDQLV